MRKPAKKTSSKIAPVERVDPSSECRRLVTHAVGAAARKQPNGHGPHRSGLLSRVAGTLLEKQTKAPRGTRFAQTAVLGCRAERAVANASSSGANTFWAVLDTKVPTLFDSTTALS